MCLPLLSQFSSFDSHGDVLFFIFPLWLTWERGNEKSVISSTLYIIIILLYYHYIPEGPRPPQKTSLLHFCVSHQEKYENGSRRKEHEIRSWIFFLLSIYTFSPRGNRREEERREGRIEGWLSRKSSFLSSSSSLDDLSRETTRRSMFEWMLLRSPWCERGWSSVFECRDHQLCALLSALEVKKSTWL